MTTKNWREFKVKLKTLEFWTVQVLNASYIYKKFNWIVLRVGCWLGVLAIGKQFLLTYVSNQKEAAFAFSKLLGVFPVFLNALLTLYLLLFSTKVMLRNSSWKKYGKKILKLLLFWAIALKVQLLNPQTYAAVTESIIPIKMFEGFFPYLVSLVLLRISLNSLERVIANSFDLVGDPNSQILIVSERWKPYVKLEAVEAEGQALPDGTFATQKQYVRVSLKYSFVKIRVQKKFVLFPLSGGISLKNDTHKLVLAKGVGGRTSQLFLPFFSEEELLRYEDSYGMKIHEKFMKNPKTLYEELKNSKRCIVILETKECRAVANPDLTINLDIRKNAEDSEIEFLVKFANKLHRELLSLYELDREE
ncbi:hypothetical protein ACFOKE_18135 [Enterococcus rivorum]|uniref:DUF3137 domain-containing protein n=2 Tax=Enterococcus rivorum TaxID=762845 RepID=A0A1E5L093_9ENTE|nr:hypothetical protein [Enterococcus rivorum]OEH83540.1 hypothetical protein BCR26_08650 [Enterococcus rivorum]